MIEIYLPVLWNPWRETGQKFSIFISYNSATNCSISRKFGTVWSRHGRYTTAVQGQGVKGQGHMLNSHRSPKYPYLGGHRFAESKASVEYVGLIWASL